ncbi:class I SAM-dependent methyltransferase [Sandaracinobacteroides hominis]|uniref:class I SAM-dependent methyltransferase n=1 Tax=Sandaracinobacteroides hominis TaxID=2780086 RepID=UPI0018F71624|nr:methyltransferase domain-containing protein [Sandaracinobacteroides hominis]
MRALLPLTILLAACSQAPATPAPETRTPATPISAPAAEAQFPEPDRPVAAVAVPTWSDEQSRDNNGEFARVIRLLGVSPGQTVADIGAGSGYYSVRLSPVVGPNGKVYVNDIIPDYLARLKRRAASENLANLDFILGDAGSANLPPNSTDLALMVHMYHEIADPFSLLWNLHDSLKPGARLAIIDADRPTERHGTPPALLQCELEATGYRLLKTERLAGGSYISVFEPTTRPTPQMIEPCKA